MKQNFVNYKALRWSSKVEIISIEVNLPKYKFQKQVEVNLPISTNSKKD